MRSYLTITLLAVLVASGLKGATLIQVFNFDESDFSFSVENGSSETIGMSFDPQPDFNVVFNQFDPSLGTLNSVSIEYNLVFEGELEFGPDGGSGSFGFSGPILVGSNEIATFGNGSGNGGPPNSTANFQVTFATTLTPITSDLTTAMVIGTGTETLTSDLAGSFNVSAGTTLAGKLLTDEVTASFSRIVIAYD